MMTTRLVADLCFPNMRNALDVIAELELEGYTVIISREIIDVFSGAAFMEAYKDVAGDGQSDGSVMLGQIEALVKPYRGFCDGVWRVSPPHLHVPFKEYKENGG
jgi:hypothetical protein